MNDRQDFVQGLNTFALTLYQKLSECQSTAAEGQTTLRNLVACPFTVAQNLAFLWSCASEKTADELAKILGFKGRLTKELVAKLFRDFHEDFLDYPELKLATKVFVSGTKPAVIVKDDEQAKNALNSFSVQTETVKTTTNQQEGLKLSDFVETINKWAMSITKEEGTTASLMNNSVVNLPKEDNDSIRPWILMDLLHMNAPWAIKFPAENTTTQRFWSSESASVDVPMMHLRESCRYGYMLEMEAAILELELDFEDFSMLFLVPDSRTGLADVLKKLQTTNVMYLAAQLRRQDTLVYVPKFKVDVTFALTQSLLGKFVSEPDAGCSPLRKSADHLSGLFKAAAGGGSGKVEGDALLLHRAVIVVGEKGTEKDKQKIEEEKVPEKFMLDRPFVFLLKYKCNIVLIGHVIEPEKQ